MEQPASGSGSSEFSLYSYSSQGLIGLKRCQSILGEGRFERPSPNCLQVEVGQSQLVFVFSFGTVVFFNIPLAEQTEYLEKLSVTFRKPEKFIENEAEEDDRTEDSILLKVQQGVTRVDFNSVTVPDLDTSRLYIVAQLLAESSALELIEWEVREILKESETMAVHLKKTGWVQGKRRELLQLMGEALSTRHRVVDQLSDLGDSDKLWEDEELHKLYRGLFDNFEIDQRVKHIEKMLELTAEAAGLLVDLMDVRRSEVLEIIVIILIAIEVVKSFSYVFEAYL